MSRRDREPRRPGMQVLAVAMPPALVAIMAIDDRIRGDESVLVHGLSDEVAHLLTALVCLAAIRLLRIRVHWLTGLLGGVLLDLDHIPVLLDLVEPIPGSSRPGTHALIAIAPVLLLGLAIPPWRMALWSLAFGMATHLFRDIATGYAPLGWPLSDRPIHLYYPIYLALLVLFAMITVRVAVMPRSPRGAPT